ncbi:DUF1707 domain-containing protein [Streptomyces morookaense]|uniref:DUF1707 SHOCT-like domain-containing protein n=1 Tax=Streptomyces morookaense TaxID=1970 RepID=UPI0034098855
MTSELPEIRASDAERERVAEALRTAVAEGRLDMEEFGERLEAAYKARTHAELVPLVRDLPETPASASPSPRKYEAGARATSRGAVAVFGGFARRGPWTVGRTFTAFTLWGGGRIDLREAQFEDRETVIRCFALFGGMGVLVPPDLDVEVRGFALFGGFGDKATGPGALGAPKVRVTGLALWGGVGVKRRP